MSLILQGSTSGSITLQEPAVAGTTVLTLPAVTGTVLTTTSPKAGNVIQVVNGVYSTQVSTTSTTFVTTNLAATITPTSSSSKILAVYSFGDVGCIPPSDGAEFALYRNSSAIGQPLNSRVNYNDTSASESQMITAVSGTYFDSPSSTSALTYTIYVRNNSGGGTTTQVFRDGTQGSITLMEIAG